MGIQIGQTAYFAKTISEFDVYGFAGLTGDFNCVHVNQIEAEKNIFRNRIAHGMLVGSFISTVLGTKLPGVGTIYLEQNLSFKKPVYIGDTVTARATVLEVLNDAKGIYKMETIVVNQKDEIVVDGYAIVQYKKDIRQ